MRQAVRYLCLAMTALHLVVISEVHFLHTCFPGICCEPANRAEVSCHRAGPSLFNYCQAARLPASAFAHDRPHGHFIQKVCLACLYSATSKAVMLGGCAPRDGLDFPKCFKPSRPPVIPRQLAHLVYSIRSPPSSLLS